MEFGIYGKTMTELVKSISDQEVIEKVESQMNPNSWVPSPNGEQQKVSLGGYRYGIVTRLEGES